MIFKSFVIILTLFRCNLFYCDGNNSIQKPLLKQQNVKKKKKIPIFFGYCCWFAFQIMANSIKRIKNKFWLLGFSCSSPIFFFFCCLFFIPISLCWTVFHFFFLFSIFILISSLIFQLINFNRNLCHWIKSIWSLFIFDFSWFRCI